MRQGRARLGAARQGSQMDHVTQRLAPSATKLLERSLREALSLGKNAIEAEHIAVALAREARMEQKTVADAFEVVARHIRAMS